VFNEEEHVQLRYDVGGTCIPKWVPPLLWQRRNSPRLGHATNSPRSAVVGLALLAMLVIPIPWLVRYYANWIISQISVTHPDSNASVA
jgi:hypothetical protein